MHSRSLVGLALASLSNALIRFPCSQLVVERLDPLVAPGVTPTNHLHQIVGGNAFNATLDRKGQFVNEATCTSCQFSEDFSNYWTAVMYFKAQNGTYKRVTQRANTGFETANGGMTIYYMQDGLMNFQQTSKVTSFPPGFRMIVGNPEARTREEAARSQQLTYICLDTLMTRSPMIREFPTKPCPAGIMVNLFFPTCWNGKDLDTADHASHMAYPQSNFMDPAAPCPATHPVKVPQVMFETIWDTRPFNDKAIWPKDGKQPFMWSFGDETGFGNHGDYVFGWKGDSLQKIMDTACYVNCPGAKQSITAMNKCTKKSVINEPIDNWLPYLPGAGEI